MSSLLSLYFLHPFSNRLANKTQRYNPRYELTNPTKTPPLLLFSPFSLLFSFIYITHSNPPLPLLLPFVLMLLCLLIPCLSSHHPLLLFLCPFVTLSSFYPVSPLCRVKNVYLSYPQGPLLCPRQGLSSMQNMPFLPLEDALLVP